jgi:hypothetical protein
MATTSFSAAEQAGLTLTLAPVQSYLTKGLEEVLTQKLGMPIVVSSASDSVRSAHEAANNKIAYPWGFAKLTEIRLATDRGNARSSALRGSLSVVVGEGNKAYVVKYIPVDMIYQLTLKFNKHVGMVEAATRLLFARVLSGFVFTIQYGKHSFSIKAVPEADSIPIGERNAEVTEVQEYELSVSLKVLGYVSLPELMEQQICSRIDIVGQITERDENGNLKVLYSTTTAPVVNTIQSGGTTQPFVR